MTTLKLDFDTAVYGPRHASNGRRKLLRVAGPEASLVRVWRVMKLTGLVPRLVAVQHHRSFKHGWHCVVYLNGPSLPPMQIVALQALCGSDWKRESYNYGRVSQWRYLDNTSRARWNVLYRRHTRGLTLTPKRA